MLFIYVAVVLPAGSVPAVAEPPIIIDGSEVQDVDAMLPPLLDNAAMSVDGSDCESDGDGQLGGI